MTGQWDCSWLHERMLRSGCWAAGRLFWLEAIQWTPSLTGWIHLFRWKGEGTRARFVFERLLWLTFAGKFTTRKVHTKPHQGPQENIVSVSAKDFPKIIQKSSKALWKPFLTHMRLVLLLKRIINFPFLQDKKRSLGEWVTVNGSDVLVVQQLCSQSGWLLLKWSTISIVFDGAETNCRIAHMLGTLLTMSYWSVSLLLLRHHSCLCSLNVRTVLTWSLL